MKLGISTASFYNKAATESTFDILRQLRVDTTEVFLHSFCEYEKPFIDSLIPRKGTINVHSVHALATQFEPELFSNNQRVRNDAEIIFRKVCYAAHALGAKVYTFHGPLPLKINDEFNFDKMGERLNHLIDIAASYGVKLSYENVHYSYFDAPEFFSELSTICPKILGTLDIKQALQSDTDAFKILSVMGERITTIHVCDYIKNKTCLPGKGKFDFERLFKEIKKRNLNIPVLMEVYSSDYTNINEIKESFAYLSSIAQKVFSK